MMSCMFHHRRKNSKEAVMDAVELKMGGKA